MPEGSQQLKFLQSQLTAAMDESRKAKDALSEAQRKVDILCKQIKRIRNEIKDMQEKSTLIISEHAIIRYIQRVMGVNIQELGEQICPPSITSLAKQLGSGEFPIGESHRVVVKDNTVVTVLGNGTAKEDY